MHLLGGILALLIGIAGWYYLFYSQASASLAKIEPAPDNRRRRRLRRLNSIIMLTLAVLLYAGFSIDAPQPFILIWLSICLLLTLILILGIADLWLTAKLKRKQ